MPISFSLLTFQNVWVLDIPKYLLQKSFPSSRQIVARTLLETLRTVTDDEDDVHTVLQVMNKLADDVGKYYLSQIMH